MGTILQSQITILFLLTAITVLIAYGINGLLADRIGRKPLLYLWSFLLPISVMIWVTGANSNQNAFLIVLIGFCLSHISYWGLFGILRFMILELVPTDKRGTATRFRALIYALGSTIGLFIRSFILFLGVNLGVTFIIMACNIFLLIPLGFFFIKETKGMELVDIK